MRGSTDQGRSGPMKRGGHAKRLKRPPPSPVARLAKVASSSHCESRFLRRTAAAPAALRSVGKRESDAEGVFASSDSDNASLPSEGRRERERERGRGRERERERPGTWPAATCSRDPRGVRPPPPQQPPPDRHTHARAARTPHTRAEQEGKAGGPRACPTSTRRAGDPPAYPAAEQATPPPTPQPHRSSVPAHARPAAEVDPPAYPAAEQARSTPCLPRSRGRPPRLPRSRGRLPCLVRSRTGLASPPSLAPPLRRSSAGP